MSRALSTIKGATGDTGAAGSAGATGAAGGTNICFYMSGNVYTGENIMYVRIPKACTVSKVQIGVSSAPTGAALTVDVNYSATDPTSLTTIFTTQASRPSIAATETSDDSAAPDITSLAAGGYLSFSIDAIGSTLPGTNLMVTVVVS